MPTYRLTAQLPLTVSSGRTGEIYVLNYERRANDTAYLGLWLSQGIRKPAHGSPPRYYAHEFSRREREQWLTDRRITPKHAWQARMWEQLVRTGKAERVR